MKTIFIYLEIIFIIVMIFSCCVILKKKTPLSASLFRLNCSGIFSSIFYLLSIYQFSENLSYVFNGIYYASMHWLSLFLLNFALKLTEFDIKKKPVQIALYIWFLFLLLDTFSLLLNPIFKHAFTLTPYHINDFFICYEAHYKLPFYFHLFFCYAVLVLVFVHLFITTLKSNKFYRYKYIIQFSILAFVIFVNIFFLFSKLKLDFSILTYCFFSVASTYFLFYSMPRKFETAMLLLVSDNINNGVICYDLHKKCIYANKMAIEYFPDRNHLESEMDIFLNEHKLFSSITFSVLKQKINRNLKVDFQLLRDSHKKTLGTFIKFSDITDELKTLKKEEFRSTHDLLTGLYNRKTFFEKVEEVTKNDSKTKYLMISTNIKNFKLVNDLYGSEFGDSLLRYEAHILKSKADDSTLLARISGDRFAVFIKNSLFNKREFESKIKKIIDFTSTYNYKLHIFAGIFECSDSFMNASLMYDKANIAIKNINENYNEFISFYNDNFLTQVIKDNNVVGAFENALIDNQFKMFLQPQIESSTEKVVGGEALVRWILPSNEIVYPTDFVPILENTGYLYKLDKFIWIEAAKTIAKWQEKKIPFHIAVNISPKDFYYLDIYKFFTDLVTFYQIPPSLLKLEITETVLMHDLETHKKVLKKLQDFGFLIEMDDFGSGYSSLNILKEVNVDILKIDMSFLGKTENTTRAKKILQSIINMAKKLKMQIVVEGVENKTQKDFLKEIGADIFQGYFYSKPVSLYDFEKNYCSREPK